MKEERAKERKRERRVKSRVIKKRLRLCNMKSDDFIFALFSSSSPQSRFQVESYTLSADHRYFLLVHDVSSARSFSTTAKFKVYDTKNSFITSLNITDGSEVQLAMWGPRHSQLVSGTLFSSSNFHLDQWITSTRTPSNFKSLLHSLLIH